MEKFRQKLAAEHQEKIRMHEEKLRQIQKERQAVFEDAFLCDLEEFKEKGSLRSKFYLFDQQIFSKLQTNPSIFLKIFQFSKQVLYNFSSY